MSESTWTTRELVILRAVRDAEERGDDVNRAARRAVSTLAEPLYTETINSLHEARYLDAAVQSSGAGKLMVHVRRLLPRGREAVGQWPTAPPRVEVDERKRRRLLFMDTLYAHVGDNTLEVAAVADLAAQLGWTEHDADPIVDYLQARDLVQAQMGNQVSITQAGIDEVERARETPDQPTAHFPPPNSIYIGGNAQGVQISLGSPGTVQELHLTETSIDVVAQFVAEFRRVLEDLPIAGDERASATSNLMAAEALLAAPKKNRKALAAVVGGLRDIVVGVAGNAAFAGLVQLAGKLT